MNTNKRLQRIFKKLRLVFSNVDKNSPRRNRIRIRQDVFDVRSDIQSSIQKRPEPLLQGGQRAAQLPRMVRVGLRYLEEPEVALKLMTLTTTQGDNRGWRDLSAFALLLRLPSLRAKIHKLKKRPECYLRIGAEKAKKGLFQYAVG